MQLVPSKRWYTLRQAQSHHCVFLGFAIKIGNLERDVAFMQVWISSVSSRSNWLAEEYIYLHEPPHNRGEKRFQVQLDA